MGCFIYHYAPGGTSGVVGQLRSVSTTPPLTLLLYGMINNSDIGGSEYEGSIYTLNVTQ